MADDPTFAEVAEAITKGEGSRDDLDAVVRAHRAITGGPVRLYLALIIFGLYGIVVVGIAAYLLWLGICRGEPVIDNLFELIKIGVLPVVVFVLGYYYGAQKS